MSISLACLPIDCPGADARGNFDETASKEGTLKAYLQTMDDGTDTSYVVAFRDLNNDGVDDAIVYLLGGSWCGSGGCTTLILRQERGSWKVVSKITIVRPSIRVLESTLNGWHDIGVWVQGGAFGVGTRLTCVLTGRLTHAIRAFLRRDGLFEARQARR